MGYLLRLISPLTLLCCLLAVSTSRPAPALASSADSYTSLAKDLKISVSTSFGAYLSYLDNTAATFPDGGSAADELLELNNPSGSNTSICHSGLSCVSAAAPVCSSCPGVNALSGANDGTGDKINGGSDIVHGFRPDTAANTSMSLSLSNLPAGPVRLFLRTSGGGNFSVTWTDSAPGSTNNVSQTATSGSIAEFTTTAGATSGTFTLSPPVGTTVSDVLVERAAVTLTQDLKITADATSGVAIANLDNTPAQFPDGATTASEVATIRYPSGSDTVICLTGMTCGSFAASCGSCQSDDLSTAAIDAGSGDQINGGAEVRHGWSSSSAGNPELIGALYGLPAGPLHIILRLAGAGTFAVSYEDNGGERSTQTVTAGTDGGSFVEFTTSPTASSCSFDLLPPVGVDESDIFVESTPTTTATRVSSFTAVRRAGSTTFHWRSAASHAILGYNLLAGSRHLNSRLIAAHSGPNYRYRVPRTIDHRVLLETVLRDGRVETTPLRW